MIKQQYIILTGSKNNAGDFLIKRKTISLLQRLRPDRDVISLDAWKPINDTLISEINQSKALILAGGPSLQTNMYPEIYNLTGNLEKISCPIISMGIGSKHHDYTKLGYKNYLLSNDSLKLLNKINNKYVSSVRDDFTLNILKEYGFENFVNTGCPVLYCDSSEILKVSNSEQKMTVCFSLGVSYKYSMNMFNQMIKVISYLNKNFNIIVLLHHKIDQNDNRLLEILEWFSANKIIYSDISGQSNKMIENYSNCYFHIGYRVHAHMYCLSIGKPSILLVEDSRGMGLNETVQSIVLKSYSPLKINFINRLKLKLKFKTDLYKVNHELIDLIKNEIDLHLFSKSRNVEINNQIDERFKIMQSFCANLP